MAPSDSPKFKDSKTLSFFFWTNIDGNMDFKIFLNLPGISDRLVLAFFDRIFPVKYFSWSALIFLTASYEKEDAVQIPRRFPQSSQHLHSISHFVPSMEKLGRCWCLLSSYHHVDASFFSHSFCLHNLPASISLVFPSTLRLGRCQLLMYSYHHHTDVSRFLHGVFLLHNDNQCESFLTQSFPLSGIYCSIPIECWVDPQLEPWLLKPSSIS